MHYKRKPRLPAQPAVLNMAKVFAAVAPKAVAQTVNMTLVNAAVSSRETPLSKPAPKSRVTLPAEDAARRQPLTHLGKHCHGYDHKHFLH